MKKKLKVLHICKTAMPQTRGGVEVFIDTLCRATSKHNVENTVLSLAESPTRRPVSFKDYKVYNMKRDLFVASAGFSFSGYFLFKKLTEKADLIHYHFPNPCADLFHLVRRPKKPTLVTYHSDIVRQKKLFRFYKPLMHNFLTSVDKIVATSPNYVKSSSVLKRHKEKVSVIPIGIEPKSYPVPSNEKLEYWSQKLPTRFFLFVGALRYYKGLYTALEAVKNTDIQLVIGGAGGIENDLRRRARENNLTNVQFLGFLSDEDKFALMTLCYSFIFPSHLRSEAFGIALLEALLYSKPLISCEIGTGTSYVNVHNETGLVIAPERPDELRDAMQFLINNPDMTEKFGKKAYERSKKFTAEEQAHAYMNIYHSMITDIENFEARKNIKETKYKASETLKSDSQKTTENLYS